MIYKTRDEEIRATISKDEAIRLIEEVYHSHYDPISESDVWTQLLACEVLAEGTLIKDTLPGEQKNKYEEINEDNTFQVRGKGLGYMVTAVQKYDYDEILKIFTTKKETSKEDLALFLAQKLEDINSLNYYETLVTKRRTDFLRNCLIITLTAFEKGKVTKSKATYFIGVLKNKSSLAEQLKTYKQKHTT